MAKQWMRACKLLVGTQAGSPDALDFSDFRIAFHVHQGTTNEPAYADIRVYNVSAGTRAKFLGEGQEIVLQAGYVDNSGTIFRGEVIQLLHRRESKTDTYLNILASTADQAHQYAIINASLAAGSTPKDRYQAVMKAMASFGVNPGNASDLSEKKLPRGRVLSGMCRDHLDMIAKDNNCYWRYNENNQVDMVGIGQSLVDDDQAIVVNRQTGMIGMPELTVNGLYLRCAINPELKWRHLIKLDNASVQQEQFNPAYGANAENLFKSDQALSPDGYYIITSLDHLGDTRGTPWDTSLICKGKNAIITPVTGAAINATAQ